MLTVHLVLMVIALICFLLAAVWTPPAPPRVSIGWLGLFFWCLAELTTALPH